MPRPQSPEHALEGLARCQLLDVLPGWLREKIDVAGVHSALDIVWYVLILLQPTSPDFLRIGIAKDLLRRPPVLDTFEKALDWIEVFQTRLVVAIAVASRVDGIHKLLVDAMQSVCHQDVTSAFAWHKIANNCATVRSKCTLKEMTSE
eukprot:312201-Amphidinium_carterae.1